MSLFVLTLSLVVSLNAAAEDRSSKLVSEEALAAVGCRLVADDDAKRNQIYLERIQQRGRFMPPAATPLKMVCPAQTTVAGYDKLEKVLTAYSIAAYKAATDESISTYSRWERYNSGTQSILLEKSFAASSFVRDLCDKRLKLIDELTRKGQVGEVVSYYRGIIVAYEKFYREKMNCTVTPSAINCPIPNEVSALTVAVMQTMSYVQYSEFLAARDSSLQGHELAKAKEFVTSLKALEGKFKEAFNKAYNDTYGKK